MSGRRSNATGPRGAPGSPVGAATLGGVPDDVLIARNPDPDSSLPYLLRVPLGPDGIPAALRAAYDDAHRRG